MRLKPHRMQGVCAALLPCLLLPATIFAADSKTPPVTAEGRKSYGASTINGKMVKQTKVNVKVQIRGKDAENAYAVGKVTAAPIVVDGKTVAPEKPRFPMKGFKLIKRSGHFSPHPKDGVGVEISYGEISPKAKRVESVSGTVDVLVGGDEQIVELKNLLNRKVGPIGSPVLKAAGLQVSFIRTQESGDKVQIGVGMNINDKNAFAGVELVGADGKKSTHSPGRSWDDKEYKSTYWIDKAELNALSLKIRVRKGWKKKTLSFNVGDVTIK